MVSRTLDATGLAQGVPARQIGRSLSAPAGVSELARTVPAPRLSVPAAVAPPEPKLTMAEAEKLVAQRVAQAVQDATAEATDKAYQEGFADGAKSIESQQQLVIKKLQEAIAHSHAKLEAALGGLEQLAVQMTQTMMERVLGADGNRDHILRQIVQHQMSQLANGSALRLRLSDQTLQDAPELESHLREHYGDQVQVLGDKTLPKGGCIIDLGLGQIDAGIETQLGLLRQQLLRMTQEPTHD